MFDEFSQGMFLLFVFQVWDRCFQLIGPLVDLLHFIFEVADMSIPRIFGHSIALPLAAYGHTIHEFRRNSYDASRRFKAVTVPGFAFSLRQTPFSSYDSLSTWMFLRMSASTSSLP